MNQLLERLRLLAFGLAATVTVIWIGRRYRRIKQKSQHPRSAPSLAYKSYSTVHENYRIWPDHLLEFTNLPLPIVLGAVALTFFLLGAAIALPFGFLAYYISTPAIYLGSAGVTLVLGAIHWGSIRVHPDYEQLRPVFTIEDVAYFRVLDEWFSRFCSKTGAALASAAVFIFAVASLITAYVTSAATRYKLHLEALRPHLVTAVWYSHKFGVAGFLILLLFAALISLALGTGGRLLILNMQFLLRLQLLPVIPMPTIVRARLRRITDLYVGTSLTWSCGVALFGILFYKDYDVLSGAVLGVLFIIGLLTFALPQAICRRYIIKSHERVCAMGLAELYDEFGMLLEERGERELPLRSNVAGSLSDLYSLTDRPKTWVYDSQGLLLWVISQAVALVAILPHSALMSLLRL